MAALLFARRSLPVGGAGTGLLGKGQHHKEESRNPCNHSSKSFSGAPRDWQRDSPLPFFSTNKKLVSQPTSPDGETRNDIGILQSKLFSISKTSCEAEPLNLEDSADVGYVQETASVSNIPLYGIPEWKKQLSVPELRSHPFLEREDIVIKHSSFFGKLFGGDHVSEVTLIGCKHGSKYSAESVQQLLESVDPDVVFVELCSERAHLMEHPAKAPNESFDLVGSIQYARKQGFSSLTELAGTASEIYGQQWLERHGSVEGGEFRVAAEFVKSKPEESRPRLVLGDLPLSFLNERLNLVTTSGEVLRLEDLYGCKAPRGLSINDEFEDRGYEMKKKTWKEEETWVGYFVRAHLDNQDLCATELNRRKIHYPDRAVVQERDVYMVSKLHQYCRIFKPKRVVVIIGAAHLRGMRHLLNAGVIGSTHQPEQVIAQLNPLTKSFAKSKSPVVRDWPCTLSFYDVERKVPYTFPRNGLFLPTQ